MSELSSLTFLPDDWSVDDFWWFDLMYYTLFEVIPLIIMLLILKNKKKRTLVQTSEQDIQRSTWRITSNIVS